MPAIGSTTSADPLFEIPTGVFIHALTITTKIADAAPLAATMMPANRCARGEILSHP
jgi:hypothetical protein